MDSKIDITGNLDYITRYTSNLHRLNTLLIQDNVISEHEKEEVESKTTQDERVQDLFLKIRRKGAEKSSIVLESLRRTGNAHVADKLDGLGTLAFKSLKKRPDLGRISPEWASEITVEIGPILISLEGTQSRYENFENVMAEISPELEYLSLKYVFATPKHLLKTFEFCESLRKIVIHNVNIAGMFSRKVSIGALEEFCYRDDGDMNDIKNMELEERLTFLQQLLFFIHKDQLHDLGRLKIKITVSIADYDYIKISDSENKNPFQQSTSLSAKESSDIVDAAFDQINLDRRESVSEEILENYTLNGRLVDTQKFLDMVNKNGEFVTSIKMRDVSLPKETLLEYLEKCPNLESLQIEDCPIEGTLRKNDRVELTMLKEFNLAIKDDIVGNNTTKIADKFGEIVPEIFFFYKSTKNWELNEIWEQRVNVRLKINSQIMMDLKVAQDTKLQLSYSSIDMTNHVTNRIPDNTNRIYFNYVQFPKQITLALDKSNLTHFVLRYVNMPNIAEFIRDCINLVVLVIYDANAEPIFFARDLGNLKRLRKISLNNATVKFPPVDYKKWGALEDLHLYHCYCQNAPNKINNLFPILKNFTFDSRNFCNSLLLKDLLKLENSITFITLWRFKWETNDSIILEANDEMTRFFKNQLLKNDEYEDKSRFSLEKVDEASDIGGRTRRETQWKISFIKEYNGPEWQAQEYKNFVFNQFFTL